MRKIMIATMAAGALMASLSLADAMPLSSAPGATGSDITLVAGGCGPGFFRGPYGGCRRGGFGFRGPGFYRPGFGRPRAFGYRRGFRRF